MTPLHQLGDAIRALLAAIPMPVARLLFVALPVALLLWVLTQPRLAADTDAGPPERSGWISDLRFWATLALAMQILIYALV